MTEPWWHRHPTWGKVAAFLLGVVGGAAVVAVLEWYWRPKCPECGRRMVRV